MGPVFLRWVACLALCGCGRWGFDAVDGDGSISGDDAGGGTASLIYPIETAYGLRGVTPVLLEPVFTGQPTFSSITPLPAGLTLDPATGTISGIPQTTVDETYVISAESSLGIATAKVVLLYGNGYLVDRTEDSPDDDAGANDVCFSTPAGGCTLRAAVQTANSHTDLRVIQLAAANYPITSALDDITADILIVGAGDQQTAVRSMPAIGGFGLFQLDAMRTLTLVGISFNEFGMRNGAVATVTRGLLVADRCSFKSNQSAGSGGVFFVSRGTARIRRSTFSKNKSYGGCCGGWGGVIDAESDGTAVSVSQCVATQNESNWGSFAHITTGAKLTLENSTLYGNMATTAGTLASPGGEYTLINSTIVGNTNTSSTPESAGLYLFSDPAHYTVQNSIIGMNTDITGAQANCNRRVSTVSLTSAGGNVFSDGAGNCAPYFTAAGDHLSTDPDLSAGAPTANGGVTSTILPKPTSTVLGAGSACPPYDQRGVVRKQDGCDVGAVELP